jgi:enoyl-CoA hydratase/carnithine racemase
MLARSIRPVTGFGRAALRPLSTSAEGTLLVDIDEERAIATLTINRPKALNALNTDVVLQIRDQYKELSNDDRVRAIVLTGSGEKAFAAGADIKVRRQNREKVFAVF